MLDLKDIVIDWATSRTSAFESEVRALARKKLHVCEIVRDPVNIFLRRILSHLKLPIVEPWQDKYEMGQDANRQNRRSRFYTIGPGFP